MEYDYGVTFCHQKCTTTIYSIRITSSVLNFKFPEILMAEWEQTAQISLILVKQLYIMAIF